MTTTETPAPVTSMPRIGDPAPAFTATTTQGEINFPADYAGKWVILFSHPADFTPVCTSEFITFAAMQNQFAAYNTELVGLSVDGLYSHIAWLRTIKDKITFRDMKNVEVNFPLIEDITMEIAQKYGMIMPGEDSTKAVAGGFCHRPHGRDPRRHLLPAKPRPQLRRAAARHQSPPNSRTLRRCHTGRLATRRAGHRAPRRLLQHRQATHGRAHRRHRVRRLVLLHQTDQRRRSRIRHPNRLKGSRHSTIHRSTPVFVIRARWPSPQAPYP